MAKHVKSTFILQNGSSIRVSYDVRNSEPSPAQMMSSYVAKYLCAQRLGDLIPRSAPDCIRSQRGSHLEAVIWHIYDGMQLII
eukprot:6197198-Pleurochrysis_carterae.AAC.2